MFPNKAMMTLFLRRSAAFGLCAVLELGIAVGQSVTNQPQAGSAPGVQHAASEMLIGQGDLLEVTVYGTDFNRQVRVNDAGEISLPLLGTVKVDGLSIPEGEKVVARELVQRGYFIDPQVSIFEREYASQAISVLGEVQKPGLYPLPGTRTLFDAISAAGGTTAKAGNKVTITHRARPDHSEDVALSYSVETSPVSNPQVYPGDTIVVSKAGIIYVVGDVKQPAGIVMENSQMTVLQAIAMAQGTNPTAKLNGSKLIRKTGNGPQEIPIRLKKILRAEATDMTLQPGDILFVPTSAAKSAARRSIEAIVQTGTGIAIYRP
jgi:polysaccharide biosynthesis/export protein